MKLNKCCKEENITKATLSNLKYAAMDLLSLEEIAKDLNISEKGKIVDALKASKRIYGLIEFCKKYPEIMPKDVCAEIMSPGYDTFIYSIIFDGVINVSGAANILSIIYPADFIYSFYKNEDIGNKVPKEVIIEAIIKLKDAKYMYKLAQEEDDDKIISRLVKAIADTNDAKYIYLTARDVKNANVNLLLKRELELKSSKYLYLFADIMNEDKEVLEKIALAMPTEVADAEWILKFAENIEGAPIEILREKIANTNSPSQMVIFACEVDKCFSEILIRKIVETGNVSAIKMVYLKIFESICSC